MDLAWVDSNNLFIAKSHFLCCLLPTTPVSLLFPAVLQAYFSSLHTNTGIILRKSWGTFTLKSTVSQPGLVDQSASEEMSTLRTTSLAYGGNG